MFLTHHSRVDLDLVGQIDRHRAVPLLLPHGERVAVEPPPGDKVQGCRVWDDNCEGVAQKEGVVPGLAAVPLVVEGSGFVRLGGHSRRL